MNNHCINCGVCCKLIPIDVEKRILLRDGIQTLDDEFLKIIEPLTIEKALLVNSNYVKSIQEVHPNATFYCCKYLSEENLCNNPSKHEYCIDYPSFPLVILPEMCGYSGEIFIKSEEIKQKVRRYKEEIIYYESMIEADCKDKKVYLKIIDSLNRFIDKYKNFGAEEW